MSEKLDPKKKIIIRPGDAVIQDDDDHIISEYLNPEPKCPCCNLPGISIKINKAHLDGKTYKEIISEFNDDVRKMANRNLDEGLLSAHFTKHFNFKGAAVAAYNRKYGMKRLPAEQKQGMLTIFDALKDKNLSDIEMLDLSMQKTLGLLQELEDLKKERIENKMTFNIDSLIMKQHQVIKDYQDQVLSKMKLFFSAKLQNKQMELMESQLKFLNQKTAAALGIDVVAMEPALAKEAERIYIKVVIKRMFRYIKETLIEVLNVDTTEMSQFFKAIESKLENIYEKINDEYQEELEKFKKKDQN